MAAAIGTGELLKGRYRLGRTLGRGGMAAVWLGEDEVLERPVAVKVLSDTIAGDPGFVARFRREAQTAAGLSHPNLVGVYDFSEEGERPYLVMQFVPGENLATRLERGVEVDRERLARELLEAVAHIHGAGILHRDIKPGNIVVEPDGTAKLIDFGIAQPRDATALTKTGLILGTERFAAPEVMRGEAATEQSDLYSCGVVLRSCGGPISRELEGLIGWLTEADPGSRPSSARQALTALDRAEPAFEPTTQAFEPEPEPAPDRDGAAPPLPPPHRSSRHGRWGAVAALVAFLVALLVVALVALGGGDDQKPARRGQEASGAKPQPQQQSQGQEREQAQAQEPSTTTEGAAAESTTAATPEPAAEGGDPAGGSSLNEQGFELIQAGDYEAAVPVLEEAVDSFPEGTEDLAYAYALFNLGNALRLSGRPEEAIPVLERRLEIPNQTATVEEELRAAQAEAG